MCLGQSAEPKDWALAKCHHLHSCVVCVCVCVGGNKYIALGSWGGRVHSVHVYIGKVNIVLVLTQDRDVYLPAEGVGQGLVVSHAAELGVVQPEESKIAICICQM